MVKDYTFSANFDFGVKLSHEIFEISNLIFSQKSNNKSVRKSWFFQVLHVFHPCFDDISAICWPIWMQNSVLERLLVVDYMTEIPMWNFKNFMGKLGSKSWNLLEKVGSVTTFSWITLKFQIFSYDKYTFSESLGCQLTKDNNKTWNCQWHTKLKQIHWQISNLRLWSSLDAKIYAEFRPKIVFYAVLNWKRIQFSESARFAWIWELGPISI